MAPKIAATNSSNWATVDEHLTVIRLRRNFGQTAAFSAGFDYPRGEVVITMDADLQNDPADVPKLMAKIDEGYDIVSGWRIDRQDRYWDRKLPSLIANRLISNVTDVQLHDYGCSLKAYRRDVLRHLKFYGELHRFIRGISPAKWEAPSARCRSIIAPANLAIPNMGSVAPLRVMLDLILVWFLGSYSTRPIHVFGTMGLLSAGGGVLIGLYLTFIKLFMGANIGGRPMLLLLAVLLVVIGVQLITMGLLGEMANRTYTKVKTNRSISSAKWQGGRGDGTRIAPS